VILFKGVNLFFVSDGFIGKFKRMLWSLIFILLVSYAGFAFLLYFVQKGLIFYPTKEHDGNPMSIGLLYEELFLDTPDKLRINAWFVPSEKARGTILFCHGNGGNISHRLETIKIYNSLGFDFFIFDYRGYGKSSGNISEKGLYIDSETAWRYLVENRKIPPDKIIIIGRSLGGAVASRLASVVHPGALIMESSFLSISEMGRDIYPFLPVKLLSRFSFNTEKYITAVKCPKFFVHSRDDEIVPFRHGQRLFELAGASGKFLELNGGHNECYFDCEQKYIENVNLFLKENGF